MDFAKFNATLAGVKLNGKKTVVTLELDNKAATSNISFLMENISEMVIVSLGDPQMKMSLSDDPRQGVKVTADESGVVQSVEEPEGEQEEMDLTYEPFDQQPDVLDEDMDFGEEEEENGAA